MGHGSSITPLFTPNPLLLSQVANRPESLVVVPPTGLATFRAPLWHRHSHIEGQNWINHIQDPNVHETVATPTDVMDQGNLLPRRLLASPRNHLSQYFPLSSNNPLPRLVYPLPHSRPRKHSPQRRPLLRLLQLPRKTLLVHAMLRVTLGGMT
jgi:hypothetical protein